MTAYVFVFEFVLRVLPCIHKPIELVQAVTSKSHADIVFFEKSCRASVRREIGQKLSVELFIMGRRLVADIYILIDERS